MQPPGGASESDFRGASPVLFSMAAMQGQLVDLNENQARHSQLLFPNYLHGRPLAQLSSVESAGTTSSQYSIPHRNSPFESYMPTSTSTSSFESGWSNVQVDNAAVPVEKYRSLQARFTEIQREHSNLVKQRDLLEAKNSALKEAYEYLVARVPAPLPEHVVLKREDYPNIMYWFRHEYFAALAEGRITSVDDAPVKARGAENNKVDDNDDGEEGMAVYEQSSGVPKGKRGKGRASQGENVKMRYIQHPNGDIIDGWRGTDIRRYARSIFVGFALDGKLFSSWVEGADAASRTQYYRDMTTRFPELGLCELDWKSEQISSEIYSQWRTHWMAKHETEKTKGKTSSKWLFDEGSKDDHSSHKKTRVLESMGQSTSLDSLPVNVPDSIPQINLIPNTPTMSDQRRGQVTAAAGHQFLAADPALLTSSDQRPQYQFSINKPFAVPASPLAPPSFLTSQGSSYPGQYSSGLHPLQHIEEPPQEDTQKRSKRPNKMRANKYSTTPRNLCTKEWVEQHHGTVEEFAAYFSALPTAELERFKALSKSLSSEQTS